MASLKQRVKGKGKKFSVKAPVETVKATKGAIGKIQTEKDMRTESDPPADRYDLAARIARVQEVDRPLWEAVLKKRDMSVWKVASPDDPDYADWYGPVDPQKQ